MFLQKTFVIQDYQYWNDGSRVSDLEIDDNVSCTTNGEYITITTSTSSEKDVKLPVTLTGNWEFETTLADLGTTNDLTFKVGTGQQWGAVIYTSNVVGINLGSRINNYNYTIKADDTLKITYIDGTMTAYWNNNKLESKAVTVTGKMGYYTNRGRVQKIKNLKLKAL